MLQIRKAERHKAKLRCALTGISGSGKTYSALLLASGLGSKICLIDTECNSGSLYSDDFEFDAIDLTAPFTPEKYIQAIQLIEKNGYEVIIVDSLSHAWAGTGGILDIQDAKTRSSAKGNSYTAWRDVTPLHNKLVEAMLQSKCHIIATMRTKTHYDMQSNEKGKVSPVKLGLAPVQREGLEYEFTVIFELSQENYASSTKDRTKLFKGKDFIITRKTGEELSAWLNVGKDMPAPTTNQPIPDPEDSLFNEDFIAKVNHIQERLIEARNLGMDVEAAVTAIFEREKVNDWYDLSLNRLSAITILIDKRIQSKKNELLLAQDIEKAGMKESVDNIKDSFNASVLTVTTINEENDHG